MGKLCIEFLTRLKTKTFKQSSVFMTVIFIFMAMESACVFAQDPGDRIVFSAYSPDPGLRNI